MKIFHFLPELNFGGTEKIVLNLSEIQQESGHEVIIIHFGTKKAYPDKSKKLNIINFPDTKVQYRFIRKPFKETTELENFLRVNQPDIIHSHSLWTDLIIFSLNLSSKRIKFISHHHLFYKEIKNSFWSNFNFYDLVDWLRLNYHYTIHKVTFIFPSQHLESYYRSNLLINANKKYHTLHNAIELPSDVKLKAIGHKEITLLTVGRLVDIKNHVFLLKAFKKICHKYNFSLIFVGNGPKLNELQKITRELKIADRVTFILEIEDVGSIYKMADLYLHSSYSETFGLTIIEAMSYGKPVVALKAGGNEEFMVDSQNGLLIDQNDQDAFTSAILNLVEDKELYQRLSKNSINTSLKYTFEQYFLTMEKFYNEES